MRRQEESSMNSPTHKVGIKILSEVQLSNIFPNYKNLLEKIKNHRLQIQRMGGEELRHYQYYMMYDNVFSVFGKRGTGKTSVAFTLREMFMNSRFHPYDVVFPIIIPEVIPSDCSALGWILAIIGEQLSELSAMDKKRRGMAENVCHTEDDFWRKCKYSGEQEDLNSLKREFEELEELYFSMKYNPSAETSYSLAVGNSARQAQNYYLFAQKITKFWDSFVREIKKTAEREYGDLGAPVTPLIFFVFDDVDLAPEKVSELMSIIIKYLSHPNIIVITTADEEMVLEVIENNLDKNTGRIPKEWRAYLKRGDMRTDLAGNDREEEEANDLISETARRYLGKVMPTSTRYYLRLFESAEEKRWFRVNSSERLGMEVVAMIDKMREAAGIAKENFLVEEGQELDFYLNFFGDTSRQIGNAFFGMQEFLDGVTEIILDHEREDRVEAFFNLSVHFMHVAINANHGLAEMIDDIEELIHEVFWLEHNGWKLYIDYMFLKNYLSGFLRARSKKKQLHKGEVVKVTLQLYSLFLFVENVIVMADGFGFGGETGREDVHGIAGMIRFICDIVFQGKQKFRTDLSTKQFFLHYKTMLNRICYLSENEEESEKFDREYLYDFMDYPYEQKDIDKEAIRHFFGKGKEWLRETTGVLSMVYGNLYLIGKKEIAACSVYRKEKGLCIYQKKIEKILNEDIRKALEPFDLHPAAKKYLDDVEQEIRRVQDFFAARKSETETEQNTSEDFYGYRQELYDSIDKDIKREVHQEFQHKREKPSEEEFRNRYQERCKLALSAIIEKIDTQYNEKGIDELLKRLPEELADEIVGRLQETDDRDAVLLLINIVQDYVVRWDSKAHGIYFENPKEFAQILQNDYGWGEDLQEIGNRVRLVTDIIAHMEDQQASGNRNLALSGGSLYIELKTALQNFYSVLNVQEKAGMRQQLDRLENSFDVTIELEAEESFTGGAIIGILVQVLRRLHRIYLYKCIVEKYNQGYGSSSAKLEKRTTCQSDKKVKSQSDDNAYYYAMFLTMKQIIEEDPLNEEGEMLKNFLKRASSEKRNQYISSWNEEVRNESYSN